MVGPKASTTGVAEATPIIESRRSANRTLVFGLGNPLLSDDGVGLAVAERVRARLCGRVDVDVHNGPVAGFGLIECLSGYDKTIIIDAIQTSGGEAGTVYRLTPASFLPTQRLAGDHEIDLPTALELGKRLGLRMPSNVVIIAVEADDIRTFAEACTPKVDAAIERAASMVELELG
jgi:hydrogenase maturation protease